MIMTRNPRHMTMGRVSVTYPWRCFLGFVFLLSILPNLAYAQQPQEQEQQQQQQQQQQQKQVLVVGDPVANNNGDAIAVVAVDTADDKRNATLPNTNETVMIIVPPSTSFASLQELSNAIRSPSDQLRNPNSTLSQTYGYPMGVWDVSHLTSLQGAFQAYTGPYLDVGAWNVARVTDMTLAFGNTNYNWNVSQWNVHSVVTLNWMFSNARTFNGTLATWNTAQVTDMTGVFNLAESFHQDIRAWDTSRVTSMAFLFKGASMFNQNIASWNTAQVTTMDMMFFNATTFDHDISPWDVRNVNWMASMFQDAESFQQDISSWNVHQVTNMDAMFLHAASFRHTLCPWNERLPSSNQLQGGVAFLGTNCPTENDPVPSERDEGYTPLCYPCKYTETMSGGRRNGSFNVAIMAWMVAGISLSLC